MKDLIVCFLWHMHQPYYTDPVSGLASMPWVRLHATKAYFDMAWLLERFPSVRMTFNFTPSLLVQLQEFAGGATRDVFLDHARRPAAELTEAERAFVVRHFFAANWATMVRPFPRYHELLVKRGTTLRAEDLPRLVRQFSSQDLLDLQVWHNLAWFGYGPVADYPRLDELRRKQRRFTEEEKVEVLAIQREVVASVIPRYRRLAEAGHIELTTSPFYHPILPLLIDTDFARRARPDLPLPKKFQAPEDAETQITEAVAVHTATFGSPPAGLWPSEGSVCPELLPMVARAGLRWLATDEGVLARSLQSTRHGWSRDTMLYQPYRAGAADQDTTMVFRDREISDAIGFLYWKTSPEEAVDDLMRRFAAVARRAAADRALLPIILDGENPWEHYHDGGRQVLSGLFRRLAQSPLPGSDLRATTATVSQALAAWPERPRLEFLHSGSWINADFKIWIGHREDNRGWDLLGNARAHLVARTPHLPAERARRAWRELYAAEGSDWFWWYGDDFASDFRDEFDQLFRTHLRNVYALTDMAPPPVLDAPIIEASDTSAVHLPVRLLSPTLDGRVTSFFEWQGAGTIDATPPLGAMWSSNRIFTALLFGFDLERLYLRLDPQRETLAAQPNLQAEIHITRDATVFRLPVDLGAPSLGTFQVLVAEEGGGYHERARLSSIGHGKIIELGIPFKDLQLEAGQPFQLSVLLVHNGVEVERYPRTHPVSLTVPDEHFEVERWRV